MSAIREREDDNDNERSSKRTKLDETDAAAAPLVDEPKKHEHILPPSHSLLGIPLPETSATGAINFMEKDVGISEYVGHDASKVEGIIKQRYVLL